MIKFKKIKEVENATLGMTKQFMSPAPLEIKTEGSQNIEEGLK